MTNKRKQVYVDLPLQEYARLEAVAAKQTFKCGTAARILLIKALNNPS